MTDRWTPEQITAHATWLRKTHGDEVETLSITETADDHGVDVIDFTGDDWDAYTEAVEKVLRSAPDLTEWEIGLGADNLQPGARSIDIGWTDGPLQARLHVAFAADMPQAERDQLLTDLSDAIAGTVPVR